LLLTKLILNGVLGALCLCLNFLFARIPPRTPSLLALGLFPYLAALPKFRLMKEVAEDTAIALSAATKRVAIEGARLATFRVIGTTG
jgi:hypothetical protein